MWAGVSALCVAVGIGSVVLLPQDRADSVRVEAPAPAAPPSTTPPSPNAGSSSPAPTTLPESAPTRIHVPALGLTSDVMPLGLADDGSMEVPPGPYPVGWYDGSPTPGELGPAVLAGHVDWRGEPGAFHGLHELVPGDEVTIDRADGTVAAFRVERVERHPKDAFPSDAVYGNIDHAGLRLITCGGPFDEEADNYTDNVIVFARLIPPG